MKSYKSFILLFLMAVSFYGCEEEISNQMSADYPQDFDIEYKLRQVIQYDPMNINGINIVGKVGFFNTVRFTLHYNNGTITKLSFNNGNVPFSPFGFETSAQMEADCELDYNVMPYELRIKGTDKVIAYFQNGEFSMPFQLDCNSISYKYTFVNVD